jgi:hypothetical protein
MGRPPIGKKPMSAAERQRRRLKRIARAASAEVRKAKAARARDKAALAYMPMPPGITYWRKVTVADPDGNPREIWSADTKPLAAIEGSLDDDDVLALLRRLGRIARGRGGFWRLPIAQSTREHQATA